MREQITLPLSNNFVESLQSNKKNVRALLFLELEINRAKIEDLLVGYHFTSREKVDSHSVDEGSLQFNDPCNGHFKLVYNVVHVNGCQDLTYDDVDTKIITFEINISKRSIHLLGEEIRERMPDEF